MTAGIGEKVVVINFSVMLTPKRADQMYKLWMYHCFVPGTRRSKVKIKFGGPELASDNRAN